VIFLISCNLIGCSSGQLFTISWPWSKRVAKNRGVKTIFKLRTLPKKFKNPPYRY
jgi:hypothetical protein